MNAEELKKRTKKFAYDCVGLAVKSLNTFLGNEKLLKETKVKSLLKESDELVTIFAASRKTASGQ